MRKFISVGLATIASLLLIFAIVFTSMEYVIADTSFLENEFTELDISTAMGISNADLVRSTVRLIDYMQGEVPDINIDVTLNGETVPMFALEQEATHMRDVQTLYLRFKQYRDLGVLVMLILMLLSAVIHFKKAQQTLAQGYLSAAFIAMLFIGFLGTWALSDFSSFWTFFHQMLFWNDLWLFDASASRMINMLPEQMFSAIVGRIFLLAGIVIGVLIAASICALIFTSSAYRRKRAAALKKRRQQKAAAAAAAKARQEARQAKQREQAKAKKRREKEKRKAAAMKQRGKSGAKTGDTTRQKRPADAEAEVVTAAEVQAPLISEAPAYTEDEDGYPAENAETDGVPDNEDVASIEDILRARRKPWREAASPEAEQPGEADAPDPSTGDAPVEPSTEDGYDEAPLPERIVKKAPVTKRGNARHPLISLARPHLRAQSQSGKAKAAAKKPAKKARGNVQDDTGFFDE